MKRKKFFLEIELSETHKFLLPLRVNYERAGWDFYYFSPKENREFRLFSIGGRKAETRDAMLKAASQYASHLYHLNPSGIISVLLEMWPYAENLHNYSYVPSNFNKMLLEVVKREDFQKKKEVSHLSSKFGI